jgi:predicted dehydrogenase
MWGDRTQAWTEGSSTAHFLLSHVVDLLHWYFAPANVKEVYAITQRQVLGYTPDLYDAYLSFDSGMKVRVKAEWIKHIDQLVEFYMCFSGREGTLIYNKRGGFGTEPGWRANLTKNITPEQLLAHQDALLTKGVNLAALIHRPTPTAGRLSTQGGEQSSALEFRGLGYGPYLSLVDHFIDAILGDTLEPESWEGLGPLPTHMDGMQQTRVVTSIVKSGQAGQVIEIRTE